MKAKELFKYLRGSWRVEAHSKLGYANGGAKFKLTDQNTLSYASNMKMKSDYDTIEFDINYKYLLNDQGLFLNFAGKVSVPICFESHGIFAHYTDCGYSNEVLWLILNKNQFDLMCSAQGRGFNETSVTRFHRIDIPKSLGVEVAISGEVSDQYE